MTAYAQLETRFKRVGILNETAGMLYWDMAAMMPEGGRGPRAEQLALMSVMAHETLSAAETGDLLAAAEAEGPSLSLWQGANLREMRRLYRHATALSGDLVEALSRARSTCEAAWREARPRSDFASVLPHLAHVLALVRESAAAKAESLGLSPYAALMDEYEPGGDPNLIDAIFADYAAFLPDFLGTVLERQKRQGPAPKLRGPFPIAQQKELGEKLMRAIGFDFAHGRLDVSAHPFCGGVPDDVRITTRYREDDFAPALMGIVHETGHALYERGLPAEWRLQPVGLARGMALHESQSLLIEMQAARSPAFLTFLSPLLIAAFPEDAAAFAPDRLRRLYHRVEPGFIRVDADEVTYPAHVILRYRLERALLSGDLAPADLPGAWNEGFAKLLGLAVLEDRLGCLQDIHWYEGAIGYFPCYSLGAMIAAQFFAAACKAVPEIPAAIARGDFAPLMAWLRREVHGHGSSLTSEEIVARATGATLDPAIFKRHLRARYLEN